MNSTGRQCQCQVINIQITKLNKWQQSVRKKQLQFAHYMKVKIKVHIVYTEKHESTNQQNKRKLFLLNIFKTITTVAQTQEVRVQLVQKTSTVSQKNKTP